MNNVPIVIAHRGASRVERENTVAAFRRARELGADWVELDVRLSLDGELIVHHDARFPDGRAVAEVAAGDRPAGVAHLGEALDACAGMGVNIEIKNVAGEPGHDPRGRAADAVVAELQRRQRSGHHTPPVLISSFDPMVLDRVRAIDPAIDTALLTFALDDPAATVATAAAAGHRALHPFDATVDAALVALARRSGLAINVWTVDDPVRIIELASLGVAGVCTNVPDVAIAALRGRPTSGDDRATG